MAFNTFSFFSFTFFILFAVVAAQTGTPQDCQDGDGKVSMNDGTRDYALKVFNGKRSEIAKGQFRMAYGSLAPGAINMKKLAYNCTLEAVVQKIAETCSNKGLDSDIYVMTYLVDNALLTINESINQASRQFFNFNANTAFGEALFSAGHAAFAYDDSTSIACAYTRATCYGPDIKANVVCGVTPVRPSVYPLYKTGMACYKDAHCTKPGYNKCDGALGLCYSS